MGRGRAHARTGEAQGQKADFLIFLLTGNGRCCKYNVVTMHGRLIYKRAKYGVRLAQPAFRV
jgi:hypothetical protein